MSGPAPEPTRPTETPDPEDEALLEVLARVVRDAQDEPVAYLEETIVPEGGE